ncbi:hypothetical protein ADIARSV_1986 [Arcticibacter svalbardensis MN12-7]|uniref:Uncharacterized protein n=1 Tax=Arcticibacter svalbardensis MN12-7 TaxID=1150600 RepID=R9GTA6_9SPHI|nr:hypothetical protein [Arcticibacter svalbardensis]EOR94770.1 hypothetical protein ADIARSV_1986 [Arcticibacter svalbardensis MN12-7]
MKKDKQKSLVKKARKSISKSIEEQLTAEITKSIISQGKDPKKVTKEIKQAVSLIAKKLAKKEGISKAELTKTVQADAEAIKDEVNSFEVAPVAEKKTPTTRKPRTPSKSKSAAAEVAATPIVRKRAPRKTVAKTAEPANELSAVTETENS